MKPDLAGMTPSQAVNAMIDRFDPAIAKTARQALAVMRKLLPGAFELVADNYNALGIGFSSSEKSSGVVMSIVLYPRWVSLFFFDGALLADPTRRLKGSGKVIRHIVLEKGAATLAEPDVRALIRQAVAEADPPLPRSRKGKMIILFVTARQRPRRPDR
jgi:hypothetical protein